MFKVNAYQDGGLIGSGFVIHYPDGELSAPDLIDIKGDRLPEGWYELKPTGERRTVVVPTRKQ